MRGRAHAESARRVGDCVTALLRDQPFFGSLALRLPIRADASRETLASDGRDIRYAPGWVAETDADRIKTAVARVVLACALKHHTRRGERDPERWQQASQLVTHGLLRDAGFVLPPDAEAWDGLSVEQAYDRLPEPPSGAPAPKGAPQSNAGGGDDGGSSGPSVDAPEEQGDQGAGDEDTASPASERAPPSHDPSGTGEVMAAAARRDDDADETRAAAADSTAEEQAWDEAMHQAMSLAKAQGKTPGAVEEELGRAHRSALDWRALLRRHMTDAARRDYSWSIPNRCFIDGGLYLPSICSEGIETIAVIVDTSGSLPAETLALFWAEVREIAAELQPETIALLQVDAAVQDTALYASGDLPERIAIKGRGGTDFRPGFAWLSEQGLRPSCCLYLTDMECDRYPEAEPDYPVIWCNWGPPTGERNREPWGERIDIEP